MCHRRTPLDGPNHADQDETSYHSVVLTVTWNFLRMSSYQTLIEILTQAKASEEPQVSIDDPGEWRISPESLLCLEMDTRTNNRLADCAEALRQSKRRAGAYQESLIGSCAFSLKAVREYRGSN